MVRVVCKIIYRIQEEIIFIVAIWDCRQNPLKMFDIIH